MRRGTEWLAVDDGTTLAAGDEIVISAPVDKQIRVREVLGPEVADVEARALSQMHTVDVVISRDEAAGGSLPELLTSSAAGCFRMPCFASESSCRPVLRLSSKRAT